MPVIELTPVQVAHIHPLRWSRVKWQPDAKRRKVIADNCDPFRMKLFPNWPSELVKELGDAELYELSGRQAEAALLYRRVTEKALHLSVTHRYQGFVLEQALSRGRKVPTRLYLPWNNGYAVEPDAFRLFDYEMVFAYESDPTRRDPLPAELHQFLAIFGIETNALGRLSEEIRDVRRAAGACVHYQRVPSPGDYGRALSIITRSIYGAVFESDKSGDGLGLLPLLASTFGVPPLSSEDHAQ